MTRGGGGGWPSPSRRTLTGCTVTSSPGAPPLDFPASLGLHRGGNQMYRKLAWQMVLCVALMLSSVADARADYRLGKTAWDAGRYAEAIEQWRRAAAKGDSRSMRQLGQVHKRFGGGAGLCGSAHVVQSGVEPGRCRRPERTRCAEGEDDIRTTRFGAETRARVGVPEKAVESSSKTGSEAKDGRTGRFIQGRSATCDVPETVESSSARDEGRH